jgi:hypothetical protein
MNSPIRARHCLIFGAALVGASWPIGVRAEALQSPPIAAGDPALQVVELPQDSEHIRRVLRIGLPGAESGRARAAFDAGDAIYVGGTAYSRTEETHAWVTRVDHGGQVAWLRRLSVPKIGTNDGPTVVGFLPTVPPEDSASAPAGSAAVRVIASHHIGSWRYGLHLIDLDAASVETSAQRVGELGIARGMVADGQGGAFICGQTRNAAWVCRMDRDGGLLWSKHFRPEETPRDAADDSDAFNAEVVAQHMLFEGVLSDDGSVVLVGMTGQINKFGQGPARLWLLRVSAAGDVLDERLIDGGRMWPGCRTVTPSGDGLLVAYATRALPPIALAPDPRYRGAPLVVAEFDARLETIAEHVVATTFLPGQGAIEGREPTVLATDFPETLMVRGLDDAGKSLWEASVKTPDGFVSPLTTLRRDDEVIAIATHKALHRDGVRISPGVLLAWLRPPEPAEAAASRN